MLEELRGSEDPKDKVRLKRTNYSHDAMIDLIIQHPWLDQREIASHFGYSESWLSIVFSSDAFQAKLEKRRQEVVNPELVATLEERFRAITMRSLEVLQNKLSSPNPSDNVALRAAELGAKALGLGGNAPPPAPPDPNERLAKLAERLVALRADPPTEKIGRIIPAEDAHQLPARGERDAEEGSLQSAGKAEGSAQGPDAEIARFAAGA